MLSSFEAVSPNVTISLAAVAPQSAWRCRDRTTSPRRITGTADAG